MNPHNEMSTQQVNQNTSGKVQAMTLSSIYAVGILPSISQHNLIPGRGVQLLA